MMSRKIKVGDIGEGRLWGLIGPYPSWTDASEPLAEAPFPFTSPNGLAQKCLSVTLSAEDATSERGVCRVSVREMSIVRETNSYEEVQVFRLKEKGLGQAGASPGNPVSNHLKSHFQAGLQRDFGQSPSKQPGADIISDPAEVLD